MLLRTATLITVLLSPALAPGSSPDAGIRFPSAGFVFDPAARAIRPVMGIPGSAVLGDAVLGADRIDSAAIAPGGAFALLRLADGSLSITRLSGGDFTFQPLPGCSLPLNTLVFSPAGTSAVAYDADRAQFELVTGLPDAPVCKTEPVPPYVDRQVVTAINDAGTLILAASGGRLLLVSDGFRELPAPLAVSALAFRRGADDAVIAGNGQIALLRGLPAAPVTQTLSSDAVPSAAVAFAGTRVIAAGASGNILEFDLESGKTRTAECSCAIERLLAVDSGSIFQLNTRSFEPLWILESTERAPRVWFVPPAADAKGESR